MHLGDGVVDDVLLLGSIGAVGGVALWGALRRSVLEDRHLISWTGALGAFVLAAQAINVPLVAGASVHLIGASLLALCLGTATATVTLTAILVIQALLLGDGGITALGVNILTLAVLPVLALGAARRVWSGDSGRSLVISAWVGTVVGHLLTATTLAAVLVLGADAPSQLTFAWLVGVHGLAGIIEGGLTASVVYRLRHLAPALSAAGNRGLDAPVRTRGLGWVGALVVVAVTLLPFASSQPDALETLLERLN